MLVKDCKDDVAVVSAAAVKDMPGDGLLIMNARTVFVYPGMLTGEQARLFKLGVLSELEHGSGEELKSSGDVEADVDLPPRDGGAVDGDGVAGVVGGERDGDGRRGSARERLPEFVVHGGRGVRDFERRGVAEVQVERERFCFGHNSSFLRHLRRLVFCAIPSLRSRGKEPKRKPSACKADAPMEVGR